MAVSTASTSSRRSLYRSEDLAAGPIEAFKLVCEIEKWPVWLSFLQSARRLDPASPLALGSEIAVRSAIPGDVEQLFEVDRYVEGHALSLVGAYSVRRRFDFRIEAKTARSKICVTLDYPAYHGIVGELVDRLTARRRLEGALSDSLIHFKGLVEYQGNSQYELTDL